MTGFAARRPGWELPQLQREALHLESDQLLEDNVARQPCPKCQRSRSLFCYDCLVAFTPLPRVSLPFKLSVVLHQSEARTKATGVHLALLAPDDVKICSITECEGIDKERAVVLYPDDDAIEAQDLDLATVEHVYVLEATWQKAKQLAHDPALQGMRHVKLPKGSVRTAFWRYHTDGVVDEAVSTIEAVHNFFRVLLAAGKLPQAPFNNDPHYFDNLLYYFAFQHNRIQQLKEARKQPEALLKKRQSEHRTKPQGKRQRQQDEDVGCAAAAKPKSQQQGKPHALQSEQQQDTAQRGGQGAAALQAQQDKHDQHNPQHTPEQPDASIQHETAPRIMDAEQLPSDEAEPAAKLHTA